MSNTKIAIKNGNVYHFVECDSIYYFSSQGNITIAHNLNGTELKVSTKLKDLEVILPKTFFRAHRSFLVNLTHVDKVMGGNAMKVLFKNGETLELSRSRKKNLLENCKAI